jgi:hypothetical protein
VARVNTRSGAASLLTVGEIIASHERGPMKTDASTYVPTAINPQFHHEAA